MQVTGKADLEEGQSKGQEPNARRQEEQGYLPLLTT